MRASSRIGTFLPRSSTGTACRGTPAPGVAFHVYGQQGASILFSRQGSQADFHRFPDGHGPSRDLVSMGIRRAQSQGPSVPRGVSTGAACEEEAGLAFCLSPKSGTGSDGSLVCGSVVWHHAGPVPRSPMSIAASHCAHALRNRRYHGRNAQKVLARAEGPRLPWRAVCRQAAYYRCTHAFPSLASVGGTRRDA